MWPEVKHGDPLTGEEKEMIRIAYGLAKYGSFSYQRMSKEYAAIRVHRYKIVTLRNFMQRVFKKLGIHSMIELVILVFNKDERVIF
jgi:hypothetical protein